MRNLLKALSESAYILVGKIAVTAGETPGLRM
jgi:hypothetical protein